MNSQSKTEFDVKARKLEVAALFNRPFAMKTGFAKYVVFAASVALSVGQLEARALASGGGAAVIRNVPYDSDIGKFGLGDLYLPDRHDATTPLVLCIHGGGWRSGNRKSWSSVAEFFRGELGFAAFNIEYRLAPGNRWPACGDDCVKAAKFVLSDDFKKKYGFSYGKIWICGGSAGGHLTLWTLVNLPPESVAGAISISAIGDPVPDFRLHHDRYSALLGEGVDEAALAGINPIALVKPGMAPLLCTHTTRDGVVPIESHRAFADAYRAAGNRCEFFEYGKPAVPGISGHCIWIPDSKPHRLIPEIEGEIRKFVQAASVGAANMPRATSCADVPLQLTHTTPARTISTASRSLPRGTSFRLVIVSASQRSIRATARRRMR